MTILAFDTALNACSVALMRDGACLARRFEWRPRGHAEALAPMIANALEETDIRFADITRIGVTIGPGSFTGVRVGLATARGLALAADIPAIGLSTLEAIAANIPADEAWVHPVLVLIDARRGAVYSQLFSSTAEPLGAAAATPLDDIAEILPGGPVIAVGSGVSLAKQALGSRADDLIETEALAVPDPVTLAARVSLKQAHGKPAPLYLRPPDAKPQRPALARKV